MVVAGVTKRRAGPANQRGAGGGRRSGCSGGSVGAEAFFCGDNLRPRLGDENGFLLATPPPGPLSVVL